MDIIHDEKLNKKSKARTGTCTRSWVLIIENRTASRYVSYIAAHNDLRERASATQVKNKTTKSYCVL